MLHAAATQPTAISVIIEEIFMTEVPQLSTFSLFSGRYYVNAQRKQHQVMRKQNILFFLIDVISAITKKIASDTTHLERQVRDL